MLRFEEPQLVAKLEKLPIHLRTAFAAACAERLFPAYARFSRRAGRGDAEKLGALLERLWRDLEGDKMSIEQVQEGVQLATALIPGEDDGPWHADQPYADDAASALAYALRCRQGGEARDAAWAAQCAYEALDHFLTNSEGISIIKRGDEEKISSHPLIQAELKRQLRDLEQLLGSNTNDVPELIDMLKRRAREEAQSIFG